MFKIGDKVVYPMHGAGKVVAVQRQEVLGEVEDYFVISLSNDLKMMVPVSCAEEVGLRDIISKNEVVKVFEILETDMAEMSQNWNKRYRANMERIKSGDIFEVADVVKNLMLLDSHKGLSTGEKRLLNTAKQMLTSEIVLVTNRSEDEVEDRLEKIVNG
ncbi:MAG: CarD family transcriptional regulator [Tissierellia bacterium]|nr:CarD family transcriptional regulator [Tissierellia bacterium]